MTEEEKQKIIRTINSAVAAADTINEAAYGVTVINANDIASFTSDIDIALTKAKNLINQVSVS